MISLQIMRRLTIVLWVTAGAASTRAATIQGSVEGADDRQPVPYCAIALSGRTPAAETVERGALSNEDGSFRLEAIPPGRYLLRIEHIGFADFTDSLTLDSGQTLDLNVRLASSPLQMQELIVQGVRPELERERQPGVVLLEADELRELPALGEADPIRSIQLLPGVQSASDISSGLYIRGGGPDQTLVLLDDVTVYNPTHAFGFFSTFNPDVLGNVTLYKGAYPADRGGRLGSVLDIRTRAPAGGSVTGTGGVSMIASRLSMQGPLGEYRWMVAARRTYLDPVLSLLRRSDSEIPSYYFYDFNARVDRTGGHGQTSVSLYTGRDDIFVDLDRSTFVDIRWGNQVASATHRRILGPAWSISGSAGVSEYTSETFLSLLNTPLGIDNRLFEVFFQASADWHPSDRFQSLFGATYSSYDVRYTQAFNAVESVNFERRPREWTGYYDQEWDPNPLTSIRTGLRLRYIGDGRRLVPEPRFSASRQAGSWRLKLGAGLYHQYLQLVASEAFSAGDFYFPIDESVPLARSWQIVAGTEWQPEARYRLGAEVYYTGLDHLLALNNSTPVDPSGLKAADIFYTGGHGYATGIEVFAERRKGAVTGWIGYTLGTTRRRFADLNNGRSFPPKYDRRHDLSLVINYRRGPWRYGASFVYATGQAFTPATARYNVRDPATGTERQGSLVLAGARNSARLLPYHRLDLSMHKRCRVFGQQAQWYVEVSNLYNRRNEWFVDYGTEAADAKVVKMLPIIPTLGIDFEF